MPSPTSPLLRHLGLASSAALVVGAMIGTGIYLKPSEIASLGGSAGVAMAAWVAGGLLSLLGAFVYLELATALPEAGADYAYLSRGWHPAVGFLYGWKGAVVQGPSSAAAFAVAVARFSEVFWPGLAGPALRLGPVTLAGGQVLSLAVVLGVGSLNLLPVRRVGAIQLALSALKAGTLACVIALALRPVMAGPGTAGLTSVAPPVALGFFPAVAATLWAYSGWHNLLKLGSEIATPERTIPRAVLGGFGLTVALFLLLNAACFLALGYAGVAGSKHPVADLLGRTAWPGAARWLSLAMALSALGSMNSAMLAASRLPYAMARDGLLPGILSRVRSATGVPVASVVYTTVFASLLVLTSTFEELTALFVFAQWLFFGLGTLALFRLRRREPELARPVRALGYPVLPALFLAGCVALTVQAVALRPKRTLSGLALILAGLPVYAWARRRGEGAQDP